jgi:hypothetical protein
MRFAAIWMGSRALALLAVVFFAAAVGGGCHKWDVECQGPCNAMPCPCGGQCNPICVAPLNDWGDNPSQMTTAPDAGADGGYR